MWCLTSPIAWCLQLTFSRKRCNRKSRPQEWICFSLWWVELASIFRRSFIFSCCSWNLKVQTIVQDNFINFDTFLHFSFATKQTLLLPSISTPNARKYVFLVFLMGVMVAHCTKVISFCIFICKVQWVKRVFQSIGTSSTSNIHCEQLEVPVSFTGYIYITVYVWYISNSNM